MDSVVSDPSMDEVVPVFGTFVMSAVQLQKVFLNAASIGMLHFLYRRRGCTSRFRFSSIIVLKVNINIIAKLGKLDFKKQPRETCIHGFKKILLAFCCIEGGTCWCPHGAYTHDFHTVAFAS